jgi:hypothetical protein
LSLLEPCWARANQWKLNFSQLVSPVRGGRVIFGIDISIGAPAIFLIYASSWVPRIPQYKMLLYLLLATTMALSLSFPFSHSISTFIAPKQKTTPPIFGFSSRAYLHKRAISSSHHLQLPKPSPVNLKRSCCPTDTPETVATDCIASASQIYSPTEEEHIHVEDLLPEHSIRPAAVQYIVYIAVSDCLLLGPHDLLNSR